MCYSLFIVLYWNSVTRAQKVWCNYTMREVFLKEFIALKVAEIFLGICYMITILVYFISSCF